ncbi:MAG: PRC-barrel domain-containing protein, partial [Clostridia bacterium]|nr:PRC-barrel domain-containing protein [Clostridia bacterium]
KVLYARREDLHIPEGALLIAEMKGMKVWNVENGAQLGTLADVIHPANTDIYVIRTEKGEAMVPVVPEFVKRVDEKEGIFLAPIEGMFD